jgi:hypothetical protein
MSIANFNQCLQDLGLQISIGKTGFFCFSFNSVGIYAAVEDLQRSFKKTHEVREQLERRGIIYYFIILLTLAAKLLEWFGKNDEFYKSRHDEIQGRRASNSGVWFQREVHEWIQGDKVPIVCHGTGIQFSSNKD